jgi:hypothetical protein
MEDIHSRRGLGSRTYSGDQMAEFGGSTYDDATYLWYINRIAAAMIVFPARYLQTFIPSDSIHSYPQRNIQPIDQLIPTTFSSPD